MRNKLITIVLLSLLTGCFGPLTREYYQPLPPAYKSWAKLKPEISELRVKKDLLECGADGASTISDLVVKNFDDNNSFLADFCMESLGYKHPSNYTTKQLCTHPDWKPLPACQPNAIIPKPSVERRLNSKYCQSKRTTISNNIKSNNANYRKCQKKISNPNVFISSSKKTFCDFYKILAPECKP